MSSEPYETRWVEMRCERLDGWGAWSDEYEVQLVSAEGVVARYDREGRLIDPGERNYSKNDPSPLTEAEAWRSSESWQSVPDGTVSHSVPFSLGDCTCLACNQRAMFKGEKMDRDQVAQVAEMIGSSLMPDNSQWVNRFTIPSSSGSRVYTVAQRRNDGVWGCSCPSWINRRHCKHLVQILKQLAEVQAVVATDPAVLAMLASARTAYLDLDAIPTAQVRASIPTYRRQIDL